MHTWQGMLSLCNDRSKILTSLTMGRMRVKEKSSHFPSLGKDCSTIYIYSEGAKICISHWKYLNTNNLKHHYKNYLTLCCWFTSSWMTAKYFCVSMCFTWHLSLYCNWAPAMTTVITINHSDRRGSDNSLTTEWVIELFNLPKCVARSWQELLGSLGSAPWLSNHVWPWIACWARH